LFAIGLAACASSSPPKPGPAAVKAPASTAALLRAATIEGIFEGRPVTLRDGAYEGKPYVEGGAGHPAVRLIEPMTASGELDGAPGDEVVALFAQTSGGSGEQIYLAVFQLRDAELVNVATADVGDRVKLRRLSVEGGTAVLDVVQTGPGEAMCCGTQLARKTYRLESGRLQRVASQVVGRLSLAAISRLEWVLDEMNGKPLPLGAQPPTFAVNGDVASGFGGCNRYSGPIKESAPGKVSLGDLAATMMACGDAQMLLEDEYLRSLRQVSAYTFLAGRLALSWEGGGERGLLLLRRK
jgi:heat shock protein HslJ